jgi:3-oxoacyl-[acyl-carrier protein] reductase
MLSLAGKSALVVGAGQGIGRQCALTLAQAGADVGALDIQEHRAVSVAAEIEALGRRSSSHVADVRDRSAGANIVTEFVDVHQRMDVVVTVVGGTSAFAPFVPTDEVTDETIDLILDINLRYVLYFLRDVLRHMKASGRGGSIVSIGSISGVMGAPNHSTYGAAKAGLSQLARSVAAEYGRFGIRMNIVSPGIAVTDVSASKLTEEGERLAGGIPLQRLGRPEDIANAVAFFASDLSGYVTGQEIVVDGGLLARWPVGMFARHPSEVCSPAQ